MMRKLLLFLILLPSSLIWGAEFANLIDDTLKYKITWNHAFLFKIRMPVAKASFVINQADSESYKVEYQAQTNNFISYINTLPLGISLPSIEKKGMSTINNKTFLPQSFIHEGKNINLKETWDITQGRSVEYNRHEKKWLVKTNLYQLEGQVFDILSALVYFRINTLSAWQPTLKGDSTSLPVINDSCLTDVTIIYNGIKEIKLDDEEVTTKVFLIKIGMLADKLLGTEADLLVYFTTDQYHLPIRMEAEAFGGEAIAILINHH